jgi:hypothetical protein
MEMSKEASSPLVVELPLPPGVPLCQPLFSLLMNSSNGSSAEQHVSRDTDVTSIVKIKNFLIFFASFIFVAKIGRRSILQKSIQRAA